MDALLNILDSFQSGWKEKKYVKDFFSILKEMIIPGYPFLESKIENHKAVFPKEWDQLMADFKGAQYF